jgi:DNA-binding CsgD family transcriptional regulator
MYHPAQSGPRPAGPAGVLLRTRILSESRLDDLVDLFAAALSEDGITGHYCARRSADGLVPLFGDSPRLLKRDRLAALVPDDVGSAQARGVMVDGVLGERFAVALAPPLEAMHETAVARVRGYCALYAARGDVLREKAVDIATPCGLTICERFILGRLLVGDAVVDIAAQLDRSVAATNSHIDDAMKTLEMADRREAIALAARRGWLLTTISDFPPLSSDNSGYYSGIARGSEFGVTGRASSGNKE